MLGGIMKFNMYILQVAILGMCSCGQSKVSGVYGDQKYIKIENSKDINYNINYFYREDKTIAVLVIWDARSLTYLGSVNYKYENENGHMKKLTLLDRQGSIEILPKDIPENDGVKLVYSDGKKIILKLVTQKEALEIFKSTTDEDK